MTPPFWNTEQRPAGDPAVHEHVRRVETQSTNPVFGEIDPQGVVQLIQKFHKFLPLKKRKKKIYILVSTLRHD